MFGPPIKSPVCTWLTRSMCAGCNPVKSVWSKGPRSLCKKRTKKNCATSDTVYLGFQSVKEKQPFGGGSTPTTGVVLEPAQSCRGPSSPSACSPAYLQTERDAWHFFTCSSEISAVHLMRSTTHAGHVSMPGGWTRVSLSLGLNLCICGGRFSFNLL